MSRIAQNNSAVTTKYARLTPSTSLLSSDSEKPPSCVCPSLPLTRRSAMRLPLCPWIWFGLGTCRDRAFRELFSLRMPIQDQRDGRCRSFVHGEIDKEPLAVGRHGVLLLVNAPKQGTACNANREHGH